MSAPLNEKIIANDYDALVLPGGVANPDALTLNQDTFCARIIEVLSPV